MAKPFFRETRAVQLRTVFSGAPCLKLSVDDYMVRAGHAPGVMCAAMQQRFFVRGACAILSHPCDFFPAMSSVPMLSTNFGDKSRRWYWSAVIVARVRYPQIQRWRGGRDCKWKKRFVYRSLFYPDVFAMFLSRHPPCTTRRKRR